MGRLGDLAVQDLLEGVYPLALVVQSVLFVVLAWFRRCVDFLRWDSLHLRRIGSRTIRCILRINRLVKILSR